jgi:YfiH family protein
MIAWIEINGLRIGTFPALAAVAPHLRVWFTTRTGGVSLPPYDSLNLGSHVGDRRGNVVENRKRLKRALGIRANGVARGGQIHGDNIASVTRGGRYGDTDGFITGTSNLALAVNSADCFPLVLHSPPERILAALHVGRSGASRGIIEKAFDLLYGTYRIDPDNTVAVLGPGICARCYEVGREAAMEFPAYARKRRSGRYHLDLSLFIRKEVAKAGVRHGNLFESGLCPACSSDFFSYRRDGGKTGRNWTVGLMTKP